MVGHPVCTCVFVPTCKGGGFRGQVPSGRISLQCRIAAPTEWGTCSEYIYMPIVTRQAPPVRRPEEALRLQLLKAQDSLCPPHSRAEVPGQGETLGLSHATTAPSECV